MAKGLQRRGRRACSPAAAVSIEPLELRVLLSDASAIFAAPVRAYNAAYQNVSPDPVDLNGDGKNDMVVTDSGGSSAKVMVLMNNGSGGFGAATPVWSGTVTPTVQEEDLNGDGKPDLIINTSGSSLTPTGVVDILINNGSGVFAAPVHVYTNGMSLTVQAVDLNGDNKLDLIIEDMSSMPATNSKVVVMLNSGNGSFGAGTQIWTDTKSATVVTAELTHDNRPDIVLTVAGSFLPPASNSVVKVLLNNGSGGFGAAATVYTGGQIMVGAHPVDLNGDNAADLVITDFDLSASKVVVILNNGNGTFAAGAQVWTGVTMPLAYPVDVTGDTRPDLIIAQQGDGDTVSPTVEVLLNSGSGVFGASTIVYTATGTSVMPIPVDLNGDTKPELIIQDWSDTTYKVFTLLNNGSGTFGALVQVWRGTQMPMVTPVDVTGDNRPDLVISLDGANPGGACSVDVLKNSGTAIFGAPTQVYNGSHPTVVTMPLDLDGDGKMDLLVEDYDTSTPAGLLEVVLNTGSGNFGAPGQAWSGTVMPSIIPVDLTGDDLPDLILSLDGATVAQTGTVDVMLNTSAPVNPTNHAPTDIALSSASVAEGQPSGTTVGTLSATDPDASNTFTYSLVSGTGSTDNSSFTIAGNALKAAASFVYATKNSYSIRIRVTDQGGLTDEKTFTVSVTQVAPTNHAPTDIALSSTSVQENQPSGTTVGTLSATDPDAGNTFTYTLVSGAGSTDNSSFTITGNALKTAASFVYATKNSYSIRIRVTDQGGLTDEKAFTITVTQVVPVAYTFGTVDGKVVKPVPFQDADGDRVTLSLAGGGMGTIDSNHVITLTGTTSKSVLTISAKKTTGDGSFTVSGISSGGLLKTINAAQVTLAGDLLVNTGGAAVGVADKLAITLGQVVNGSITTTRLPIASLKLLDWQDTDAQADQFTAPSIGSITISGRKENTKTAGVEYLPGDLDASITTTGGIGAIKAAGDITGTIRSGMDAKGVGITSIAATGSISGATIVTKGSIGKFSAASLEDSQILVGVASGFAGQFAGAGDFANSAAKLGSLTVAGRKLPAGQSHPAYVVNSHISAANVGTISLLNVPADSGPMVHVLMDVGTLKVARTPSTIGSMFPASTWKTAGNRPMIWQVV